MEMSNLGKTLLKGLNSRTDIDVVDTWCYTLTLMIKAVSFFEILPDVNTWTFIKDPNKFLHETLNGNKVFVILDCENNIKPLYLVISGSNDYLKIFDAFANDVDEDEFFKNVGFFPENLSANKSERDTNFSMINAKRIATIENSI